MSLDHAFHKEMMELPDSMSRARHAVKTFPDKVVVFTGAGISAESGISPFRNATDGESLWDKYDPAVLSSMDGFMESPGLVWSWYYDRLAKAAGAAPNAGHYALTFNDAPVITQNVDTLHEKAGSTRVLHMHGRGDRAKCTSCDWHGSMDDLKHGEFEHVEETWPNASGSDPMTMLKLPACPACGAMGRPDVVWFGEMLDYELMREAQQLLMHSICVVVGTSGQVEPMASFPNFASLVISVNPRESDHIHGAIRLTGTAGEVLPKLFA